MSSDHPSAPRPLGWTLGPADECYTMRCVKARRIRRGLLALTLVTLLVGSYFYVSALSQGGMNLFDSALIPLFVVLFGWISFSFWSATLGFALALRDLFRQREAPGELPALDSRTALVVPVYNESSIDVMANVLAMRESLESLGVGRHFDLFILSDTTDPDVWLEEERLWAQLADEDGSLPVYYRHRSQNTERKSGNIADFVQRFGHAYDFFTVLDADSLMEGRTLVEMSARMEKNPRLALLQVPPAPVNCCSLFARWQQFSAACYGEIYTRGYAGWSQMNGNYWGHNAILRTEPFLRHCRLPTLPGQGPLGGEVLSHDFVEAALLARAGWDVELADDLKGSYEECPTALVDFAMRDQRWCQGNLQHLQLLASDGLLPMNRVHMSMGVMSYLSAPLWVLAMLLGAASNLWEASTVEETAAAWPNALVVFGLTMGLLLWPKVWSLLLILADPARTRAYGGAARVAASVLIETVLSVLLAPVMMCFHTRFVVGTFLGQKVEWNAQRRGDGDIDLASAIRVFGPMTLAGAGLTLLLLTLAPWQLLWFTPLALGLVLSLPMSRLLGNVTVGQWLAKHRLLLIPEETDRPEIYRRRDAAEQTVARWANLLRRQNLFRDVLWNPTWVAMHCEMLRRTDGRVSVGPAEADEILRVLETDGQETLTREQKRALLRDDELLEEAHLRLRTAAAFSPVPV